jgi:hypothetical protein
MTPRIPENVFTWFADWGPVTIMVNTMPPRDPNAFTALELERAGQANDAFVAALELLKAQRQLAALT